VIPLALVLGAARGTSVRVMLPKPKRADHVSRPTPSDSYPTSTPPGLLRVLATPRGRPDTGAGELSSPHANRPRSGSLAGWFSPRGATVQSGTPGNCRNGGAFSFGNFPFHGSVDSHYLNAPVVGIAEG
jgi:hypothetical protein